MLQLGSNGLRIEEGGFGKGAGLRDALAAARSHGAACAILDFGGQVAVGGACSDTTIAISNPDDRHLELASLTLETGSAATSGLNQRFFTVNGVRHGHILDPRSGRPVDDWGAVTVIAADPLDADCVSTALYVMGPDSGVTWAANHPEIEAIFAENTAGGLRLRATAGLRDRLSTPSDLAVEWIAGIEARHHGPPPSAR